ncbi:MAG: DUF3150 domain-containing protein [Planctomycetaceae bacterium]|jgi:hypothetical protein|nr:DUF3150 domain-containing protein [Planctomycetaceae bacterium]
MLRKISVFAVCAATLLATVAPCSAQWSLPQAGRSAFAAPARPAAAGGGLLARLNRPLVPTLPGTPTASPLGLIAPRLSMLAQINQLGGLKTPAGRLAGLGVLAPRISPLVAMVRKPPVTRQARMLYGLTILAPRATALVGMLQSFSKMAAVVR